MEKKKQKILLIIKTFLLIWLLLSLLLGGLILAIIKINIDRQMAEVKADQASKIKVAAELLSKDIVTTASDVLFLANIPAMARYIEHEDSSEKQRVEEAYQNMLKIKSYYLQVRYLNSQGIEVIRVHKDKGQLVIVPKQDLQSKADRPYVSKTLALDSGEIYVSPLDLNIENNKTVIPYQLVVRIATPVFAKSGANRGLVIINLDGDSWIKDFTYALQDSKSSILLNSAGQQLNSSQGIPQWNFAVDKKAGFYKNYPQEWQYISDHDNGVVLSKAGLFTFATVYLQTFSLLKSSNKLVKENSLLHEDHLKLVSFIPAHSLPKVLSNSGYMLPLYFLGLLSVIIASFVLARILVNRKELRESIISAAKEVEDLYENAPCGYHSLDENGYFVSINKTELDWLGYRRDELIGKLKFSDLLTPGSVKKFIICFKKFKKRGYVKDVEFEICRKNGSVFWGLINAVALKDGSGKLIKSRSNLIDITTRKIDQDALQQSEARFRKAMENAPIGMAIISVSGQFLQVNNALCEMLGYDQQELQKLSLLAITHPDDVSKAAKYNQGMVAGMNGSRKLEKRCIRKNGQSVWIQITTSILRDKIKNPIYGIVQIEDITERKLFEDKIQHMAFHDPLTRLPNRFLMLDRLKNHAINLARRKDSLLAVLFLDVDKFKQINDSMGHAAGDELLKQIAQRLLVNARSSDTVCRLSGDEFVVVLSEISKVEDFKKIAQKIYQSLTQTMTILDTKIEISVSIGVAILLKNNDDDDAKSLLRKADLAMYAVKKQLVNEKWCLYNEELEFHLPLSARKSTRFKPK